MTYSVFGGTLNLAQLNYSFFDSRTCIMGRSVCARSVAMKMNGGKATVFLVVLLVLCGVLPSSLARPRMTLIHF